MHRLAIDLGTSNTVAVVRVADGGVRPVLFDGHEQLPSAVYAGAEGGLVAGGDAERLARADPAAFEPNPKRRIDDGTVLLGGRTVDVADALAAVLGAVVRQFGPGEVPAPVVLTVPAGWAAARRAVLIEAAARAGLGAYGPVTLVSEPIAAAAYYTARLGHGLPALIVDLGAGTADVALVRAGFEGPEVVAQGGLDVGGLDVDAALVDLLGPLVSAGAPEQWQRLAAPVTAADRRDRLLLWQEVRAAKESLSRLAVAPVHVPGCAADLHLTREELEAVAAPLLAPVADLAAELVTKAGPARSQLAGVFLVGGGSRLPLLARLLHARLGPDAPAPTAVERPETVVAEGALLTPAPELPAAAPTVAAAADAVPLAAPEHRRTPLRRRWLSPTTLVLVLLCFVLPFATVSCLPAAYGHAVAGAPTTYNGLDLALGGSPDVPVDHQRPSVVWQEDRLAPQPLFLVALLAVGSALGVTAALARDRRRRGLAALLGGLAVLSLLAGQAVAVGQLASAVREQATLPADKAAREFVGTGAGFWLALTLLTLFAVGNAVALLRRSR